MKKQLMAGSMAVVVAAGTVAWALWLRPETPPTVTIRTLSGLGGDALPEECFVTCDGRLVIGRDNELLVFANGAGVAASAARESIPDLARRLGLDDNLPLSVRDYQCALSLMNIPAAAPRGPLYAPREISGLCFDNDCQVHQVLDERHHRMASKTFTRVYVAEEPVWAGQSGWLELHPYYKLRPDLMIEERAIVWGQDIDVILHTWDGRKTPVTHALTAIAGSDNAPSFESLLPFRNTRMCLRIGEGIASSWDGDRQPEDTDIVIRFSPTGLRTAPTTVTIAAKGKHLVAWFDGFDGSVSVILLDNSKHDPEYVWYHIR